MANNQRYQPRGGQRFSHNSPRDHYNPVDYGYAPDEGYAPFKPFQASAPRGRSNWKGKSRPTARVPQAASPATSEKPLQVPQGAFLSKGESVLKNDPLYNEAVFCGPGEGFSKTPDVLEQYPGFEGLTSVIDAEYNTLCSTAISFAKNVSPAMYAYYAFSAAFYRMLKIHHQNANRVTEDESEFIRFMENFDLQLPQTLSIYLSGFGNTLIHGKEIKAVFVKPDLTIAEQRNEVSGYFGPIGVNAGLYARYPCLGVAAQRITEDLRRTRQANEPAAWDLPEDIFDPEHAINEFCLGYKPAISLREDIVNTLEALGIGVDNFPSSMETIPFNVNLLIHVKTYLSTVRGLQTKPLPSVPTGSVAQLIVTIPSGHVNEGTFIQRSYDQVPVAIGVASEGFTYHISRRQEDMTNEQF